jgi:hypothetical protein
LFKPWPSLGQTLFKPCSNLDQTLFKPCSNLVQTLVKHWSNLGQTLVKSCSNLGQTLANIGQTLVKPWSNLSSCSQSVTIRKKKKKNRNHTGRRGWWVWFKIYPPPSPADATWLCKYECANRDCFLHLVASCPFVWYSNQCPTVSSYCTNHGLPLSPLSTIVNHYHRCQPLSTVVND